jgi:hypothetical protein
MMRVESKMRESNWVQDELPLDWHEKVPTEGEIRESLNKAKTELPLGENLRYATPNEFMYQYSNALQAYLEDSLGTGKSHLEDLVADTKAFSQAFLAIVTYF